ncbi:hypothetical protein R1sor_003487 [Riccia sorocarpa]|uniref:C2H2-type domain-containing protein n=1 Tax=Riccia sorocarpa TaxID=122646 RepID=A0ABD3H549_9MARC
MGIFGYREGETLLSLRNKLERESALCTFECLECHCQLGKADKCEDKVAIQNLFINYRNKHIGCEKHLVNWRKRRNIPVLVCKEPVASAEVDHMAETNAGLLIVQKVNEDESGEKKPFVVEGDVEREPCYSWIFRVRCIFCGKKFELVPTKRNLEHNLREHLSCENNRQNVEQDSLDLSQGPVRTGAKGRPRKSDPHDMKRQRSIKSFFGGTSNMSSSSLPSPSECISGDEVHGIVGDVPVIFAEDETRVKPRIRERDNILRRQKDLFGQLEIVSELIEEPQPFHPTRLYCRRWVSGPDPAYQRNKRLKDLKRKSSAQQADIALKDNIALAGTRSLMEVRSISCASSLVAKFCDGYKLDIEHGAPRASKAKLGMTNQEVTGFRGEDGQWSKHCRFPPSRNPVTQLKNE